MLDVQKLGKRRVEPDILTVSLSDRQGVIADDELRIRIADVRPDARIVGVEVRNLAGRRVHHHSDGFRFQGAVTVGPQRWSGASQGGAEDGGRQQGRCYDEYDYDGNYQCCDGTVALCTADKLHCTPTHRD